MKGVTLSLAALALCVLPQDAPGQRGKAVDTSENRVRSGPARHHADAADGPRYRDDVPKWVPIVFMVVMGISIAAVAIAFQEARNKIKWAFGSVLFLAAVAVSVYLVFFVLLGIPHN